MYTITLFACQEVSALRACRPCDRQRAFVAVVVSFQGEAVKTTSISRVFPDLIFRVLKLSENGATKDVAVFSRLDVTETLEILAELRKSTIDSVFTGDILTSVLFVLGSIERQSP